MPKNEKRESIPPEVLKLAKSFGVDVSGFEAEAADIWKRLEDMSSNDPVQYEAFLSQQMNEAKAEESASDSSKCIRPNASFCLMTNTLAGDGLKIREIGQGSGKRFYINFCHHEAIELPLDQGGRPTSNFTSSHGLQIPMLVGEVRTESSNTRSFMVVDVLFNRVVVDACIRSQNFKSDLMELAFQWIQEETGTTFRTDKASVTECSKPYIGGR